MEADMGERVLRGSRLGTTSYESDRNTDLAPRREVVYDCPSGHETRMTMASDADIPATWECRSCGVTALQRDGEAPEGREPKHARTHWDMLLERRSVSELEDVLNERLAELHPAPKARRKSA
jgi:rubredoxin